MADDFGTVMQGESIPDMLKFASWASMASAVLAVFMAFFTFFFGGIGAFFNLISLLGGNFLAIVCVPMICLFSLVFIAIFAGIAYVSFFGGFRALKGQAGAKLFLLIGAIANVVIGFMTLWFGFGIISLGLGGFVLYVIFADEPSIKAFEVMEGGEWDKHPHDFTGKPEVTVHAEVAASAAASAKASAEMGASAEKPAPKTAKAAPVAAKWSGRAYEYGKVYHEAPANLMRGKEAVGGKVKVTPEKVIFESHGANIQTGKTEIPIETIKSFKKFKSLGIVNNGLTMVATDGQEHKFVVDGRDAIEALIKDIQAAIAENAIKTSEI